MLRELLGDALRVLALPVHAQPDRRQATVQHPAFVGLQNISEQICAGERIFWINAGSRGQRDAADQIAEAGKIFGRRIQHQIRAQFERMLERRPEHGVVHHHERLFAGATPRPSAQRRISVMMIVGFAGVSINTTRRFLAERMVGLDRLASARRAPRCL